MGGDPRRHSGEGTVRWGGRKARKAESESLWVQSHWGPYEEVYVCAGNHPRLCLPAAGEFGADSADTGQGVQGIRLIPGSNAFS